MSAHDANGECALAASVLHEPTSAVWQAGVPEPTSTSWLSSSTAAPVDAVMLPGFGLLALLPGLARELRPSLVDRATTEDFLLRVLHCLSWHRLIATTRR